MRGRLIDLSVALDDVPSERVPVRVRRVEHHEGADEMSAIFSLPRDHLPDGLGWAGEGLTLITHAGTHMDAPWHYGPTSAGQPARFIDAVPLEWCVGPAVVLDFRSYEDGALITVTDLKHALERIGHALRAGEIVLIMTGADVDWGQECYVRRGCGLGREATLWLVERGVRVIGTDAWGLDRSFEVMRDEYHSTRDPSRIWPAHFAGREREYCQLEKLANLAAIPPTGAMVMCFPVKIARAGAAWVRAVALLPELPEAAG
jgi:kynurenine formamidase